MQRYLNTIVQTVNADEILVGLTCGITDAITAEGNGLESASEVTQSLKHPLLMILPFMV